ncbi:hypothetical protein [Aeromonas salmonicida]|uniref:hypothetical protein n=1 Tax=Aeromonas salmonicida TaxID=645 RepID=UPI003D1BE508
MFRIINWLASGVLFPLTPMLAVWFLKGLESGHYTFSNVSATDLAFATAMICVVSIIRVKNLGSDPQLQESMSNIFSFGLIICLILFTASLLYQIQADALLVKYYKVVSESMKNGGDIKLAANGIVPTEHDDKIGTFRIINAFFSFTTVITALFCNFKYDLDRP